ncbi:hypothetical protein BDY21DRAFT_348944 [Lineolata rhizophorae]|uniref:Uncharacterized protein n=1 Tax=Lineolata rhizophorae TaxID=578093 RepID=A0A6A6NVX7_9PEZI|nr:hypothetical protein BDY21DRAFT_348944 [Lineolata rhizophorae]
MGNMRWGKGVPLWFSWKLTIDIAHAFASQFKNAIRHHKTFLTFSRRSQTAHSHPLWNPYSAPGGSSNLAQNPPLPHCGRYSRVGCRKVELEESKASAR